jgi:hypothetical protein
MNFHCSKACVSIRYLASVLIAVCHHLGFSHVQPISARRFSQSMLAKRVLPTIWCVLLSVVTNGTAVPALCQDSAVSMYFLTSSGVRRATVVNSQMRGSEAAASRASA